MIELYYPSGWDAHPSEWSRRLPGLLLALVGLGIATYLGLYQVGIVPTVWEPFFGTGSEIILRRSAIAHFLPVPDAFLGAGAYFLEALLELFGGSNRWRAQPWIVLGLGLVAFGMGAGGIFLVLSQPLWFHAWCTLCIASAICSLALVGAVVAEVRATIKFLVAEHRDARPIWRTVWGRRSVK